jgi:hypothetical protein
MCYGEDKTPEILRYTQDKPFNCAHDKPFDRLRVVSKVEPLAGERIKLIR